MINNHDAEEVSNFSLTPAAFSFLETECVILEYLALRKQLIVGVPWQQKEAFFLPLY